ncbi:hypothetical protein BDV29DRAFT_185332 [Aspergillus leporis]|uniref:NDT80 domain-containing protein n=1 Tax=Aspergillus leporis TaxID=41062 RepID=A0A5N5WL83_9EURO|nr:hypothetical protein BDV29DRAFT_185332 [Aspergillus leporis]
MEGHNAMAMAYFVGSLSLANIQRSDYLEKMSGIESPGQHIKLDLDTFACIGDVSSYQNDLLAPLSRFSSGCENSFSDMVAPFGPVCAEHQLSDSSVDHNKELLRFSIPVYNLTLLDSSLRRTSLSLSAQLHGMFFLVESPRSTFPEDNTVPRRGAELTCYRRNLFHITGLITLPRSLRYIVTEQGDYVPILAQEVIVSATESMEGNPVKIISVPWKTPAVNESCSTMTNISNGPKLEQEPPPIHLDNMIGHDQDTDFATFPITWKRLQFRVATANNGRRKQLQQYFVIQLKVIATLFTGAKIPICEVESGPVIVRGRSPRSFQSRKGLPLSSSAAAQPKNVLVAHSNRINHTSTRRTGLRSGQHSAKARTTGKSTLLEVSGSGAGVVAQRASPNWTQVDLPAAGTSPTTGLLPSCIHSQFSWECSRSTGTQQRPASIIAAPINLPFLYDDNGDTTRWMNSSQLAFSYTGDVPQENINQGDCVPLAEMRKLSHKISQPTRSTYRYPC